jgi:hypothetical protein
VLKVGKRLVLLSLMFLVCSACNMKMHKDFSFTSPKAHFGNQIIQAKLRGTMVKIDKDFSESRIPYEMLLWLSDVKDKIDLSDCVVNFSNMSLRNLETNKFISIPKSDHVMFRKRSDGTYAASVIYKGLNLKYADHQLQFDYSIENCGINSLQEQVNMRFSKSYNERNISFWDVLMGV